MERMKLSQWLLLSVLLAVMAGCTTSRSGDTSGQSHESASESTIADGTDSGQSYGAGQDGLYGGQNGVDGYGGSGSGAGDLSEEAALRAITTFYFEYDSSELRPDAMRSLDVHARDLKASRAKVVLEGHTDERGTREYNMALGERRAKAVQRYLMLQGVAASQLEVVSWGEERPAVFGSDEYAWAQNRRVELRLP